MSNVQPQPEPSMEEILASIRRIISDDTGPGAAPAAGNDDVLDLTDAMVVDNSPNLPPPPPEPSPAPSIDDLMASFENKADTPGSLDMTPEAINDSMPPYQPEPEAREPERVLSTPAPDVYTPGAYDMPQDIDDSQRIISPDTEAAAAAALAGVNALVGARIESMHKFEGGTVEALVRELLRPMLREWCDRNLPTLVERLVEDEIQRITSRVPGGR